VAAPCPAAICARRFVKCREWHGRHGSTGSKSAGVAPGGIGIGGIPIGGIPGKPTPAGIGPTLGLLPNPGPDEELLVVAEDNRSAEFLVCVPSCDAEVD